MSTPSPDQVSAYYNERIDGKLRDFTHPNPRIEAAVETVAAWAPLNPRRILEIGCGIGATSWRMARAWPHAEVIGVDISSLSIEVARTCFRRPNLSYRVGVVEKGRLEGVFDLIVLMDVYEHIAPEDRPKLHAAIRTLLADESRVVFTVPTPRLQQKGRISDPGAMQPVDEDVTISDIVQLAADTDTHVLYFRELGIWRYGDYAHFVLGRYAHLKPAALREFRPAGVAGVKHRIKRLVGRGSLPEMARDYLGTDVLRPRPRHAGRRFHVSIRERRLLAAAWQERNGA